MTYIFALCKYCTPWNIPQATSLLLDQLRPELVSLTDAFDYPDNILNSTLGRADGNYMEALYAAAKENTKTFHDEGKVRTNTLGT